MTLPPRKRAEAAAIAAIGTPIIEAMGGTYHWHEHGAEHIAEATREGRAPIFSLWHGRIFGLMLYLRDRQVVWMISENFDGEWIARISRRFGHLSARGSSSRGSVRALVGLRKTLRAGLPAGITVDGPRGPARKAQAGAVWLASSTGHPILPIHVEASRHWTTKSWDRHQIPKPGSHLVVAVGEPIDIAPRADAEAIEDGRARLEASIGELEEQAKRIVDTLR